MATIEAPVHPHLHAHEPVFRNEPATDFSRSEIAREMRQALDHVHGQLGREYDLIIDGHRVRTQDKIISINPARPSEVVGIIKRQAKSTLNPRCKRP